MDFNERGINSHDERVPPAILQHEANVYLHTEPALSKQIESIYVGVLAHSLNTHHMTLEALRNFCSTFTDIDAQNLKEVDLLYTKVCSSRKMTFSFYVVCLFEIAQRLLAKFRVKKSKTELFHMLLVSAKL